MSRPWAILLAAGEGRRMGGVPKALLRYDGDRSFLRQLAQTFAQAGCEVLAVVGAEAARVQAAHRDLRTVLNDAWRDGQLTSAALGLKTALDAGADVVLVHPVDMPALRIETIRALLDAAVGEGSFPTFDGQRGHPLVLSASAARGVLKSDAATLADATFHLHLQAVDVPDPGVAVNFNTQDAYERVFGRAPSAIDA